MRTSWSVAYRKKSTGTILYDTETPFITVKNSVRFWAADPFVFENDGETFIFAEVYDAVKSRGTIGYCRYNGSGFSSWKSVISEDYHLSFPYIFRDDNDIYIMPEAHQSNELYLYKAVGFPDKWKKHRVLYKGKKLADSVMLNKNGKSYIFSYEINYPGKNLLLKGTIDNNGDLIFSDIPVSDDDGSARPGGKFFEFDGKTIRVSQDCLKSYGDKIVFSKAAEKTESGYSETVIKRISKDDIKTFPCVQVFGTHTYNSNDSFEVIDIKTKEPLTSYLFSIPFRIIKKLKRRIKRK